MILKQKKKKHKHRDKDKKSKKRAREKVQKHIKDQKGDLASNPFLPKIPQLTVTDQTNPFIAAIENVYSLAVSSSLAAAIVELKILHQVSQDGEGSGEEVENRFDKERYLQLHNKLLELKSIKEIGSVFGLDNHTIDQILTSRIDALFGRSGSSSSKNKKAFLGTDEQFLTHLIKKKISGEE